MVILLWFLLLLIVSSWFYRALLNYKIKFSSQNRNRLQSHFFTTTFQVLGYMAKLDGRVTENEIQIAEMVMKEMRLTDEHRKKAIQLFNTGKYYSLQQTIAILSSFASLKGSRFLMPIFITILLNGAYADGGKLTEKQELFLLHLRQSLGINASVFHSIHQNFLREYAYKASYHKNYSHTNHDHSVSDLKQAYDLLGANEKMSDAEIKRTYRKLMSQNHPDKLVHKGLPQEMIDLAKRKTQDIQSAYDKIMAVRQSKL